MTDRIRKQETRSTASDRNCAYVESGIGYIPLRRCGRFVDWAKVDATDFHQVVEHSWAIHGSGFVARSVRSGGRRHTIYLQRAVLGLDDGGAPQVRFKNGDRLDCRRANLRPSNAWAARSMSNSISGWALVQIARSTNDGDAA